MELQNLDLVCPACHGTGFKEKIESFSDLLSISEYEKCFCDDGVFHYLVELDTSSLKRENKV